MRPLKTAISPLLSACSLAATVLACSSASTSTAPAGVFLSGTYKAVTPGSMAEITFYLGDHYALVNGTCADALQGTSTSGGPGAPPSMASCYELGRYSVNGAATTLNLSPTVGPSRELPLRSLLGSASYSVAAESLHAGGALHTLGNSLTGADASLTAGGDPSLTVASDAGLVQDGGALVPCPGGTLAQSGVPLTHAMTAGGQSLVGGAPPTGTPDPTQGGGWSCSGSYDTELSTAFYLTSFGCSGASPAFQDSGDNCCGAGAPVAAAAGLCGNLKPASTCSNSCANNSSCNTWRKNQTGATAASFQCEEMVNYYSTGAVAYGLGARLCLSTPGGKGVVVFVYDDGPSCSIERRVSAHVLDVSPPTAQYLFGESQISATERKAVFATTVAASTPLGPNDGCASAAASGSDGGQGGAAPSGGGAASASDGTGSGAGEADASCAPASECAADSDCNPGGPLEIVCVSGSCQTGCHSSAQCAPGTSCGRIGADSIGSCQGTAGGASCTNDGACNPGGDGAGMICSGGACTPGCHASYQCPGNTSCHAGQCR